MLYGARKNTLQLTKYLRVLYVYYVFPQSTKQEMADSFSHLHGLSVRDISVLVLIYLFYIKR